ncbi:hypothetical protein OROMI_030703 [Orobanche minor]
MPTLEDMHVDHEEVFPNLTVENWAVMYKCGLDTFFGD